MRQIKEIFVGFINHKISFKACKGLLTKIIQEFKVHIFWEGHKICVIFTLLLSYVVPVKSKMKISQNFVAFSEYLKLYIGYHTLTDKRVIELKSRK